MNKYLVIFISSCSFLFLSACNGIFTNTGNQNEIMLTSLPQPVHSSEMQHKKYAAGHFQANTIRPVSYLNPIPVEQADTEKYQVYKDNPVKQTSEQPVSTFSIDVDTASYSNVRRMIMQGNLPPEDAVKIEEFINYFDYDYPIVKNQDVPFSISTEIAPAPWNKSSKLLHIGIKGYDIDKSQMPQANLVFLIDVSGSMHSANKLPLVKKSLKLLLKHLTEKDKISLVVYAGAAGVVLEPTPASEHLKIEQAIEQLSAGGATNGEAGIRTAYKLAKEAYIKGGINRIIIASDGDMNVGISDTNRLKELIKQKRKSGISLTTLGYGHGNYNYDLMEQLADIGNGTAAYIDSLLEAQKVLVNEMSSTLLTIAKDVKVQIEFSPKVKEYRLIGYENRMLKQEDFNNDKVDAGDIGAGHTVTALYEIVLAGDQGMLEPLRYTQNKQVPLDNTRTDQLKNELAFLKIRYKKPDQNTSQLISTPILTDDIKTQSKTSARFRFSASVAAYGQLLRGGKYTGQFNYNDIIKLAQSAREQDEHGYRANYIELVKLAKNLSDQ